MRKRLTAFRYIISLSLSMLTLNVMASSANSEPLANFFPSACHVSGHYTQNQSLKSIEETLRSDGRFIFSCGQGLIWHTTSPFEETIVYSNDQETKRFDGATFASIDSRLHKFLGTLLNNLIGGNHSYLEKHFTIENSENALVLHPKKKRLKKFIKDIQLVFSESGTTFQINHPENTATQILIHEIVEYASFDESFCTKIQPLPDGTCKTLFQ